MADATSVTFYGLFNQVGRTVTVFCCGLDCGDYAVSASGTVTVPFGADVDGLFTITKVQSTDAEGLDWGPLATQVDIYLDADSSIHTYTVPACVGFTYTSRGQLLRPIAENEVKSSRGSGLGKKRRVHKVGALLNGAIGIYWGTDFDSMTQADLRSDDGTLLDHATMFSGVYWDTIEDNSTFDGMVAWEISRPYPCTVVSITSFMEMSDG